MSGEAVPYDARAQILACEAVLKNHPEVLAGDSSLLPLTHHFAEGLYVRELFIPKGTLYVGAIHKYDHPRFLMQGKLIVFTEFAGTEYLEAPSYMITKAGTKRVGFALEDTIVITVHATHETDLDTIEADLLAPNYEALERFLKERT